MHKFAVFAVIFAIACPLAGQLHDGAHPNVLLILVDDLGARDLGCYGSTFYETPQIDSLARDGVRFTAAYAASPVCSPTRAAILTGRHPARVGITDWIPGYLWQRRSPAPPVIPPDDLHNLPESETTLAEALKSAGYRTFFAGKWHLGEDETSFPRRHGFEINLGGNASGQPRGPGPTKGYYVPYRNPQLHDGPAGEYLTDRLTTETIRFMSAEHKSPFFAMLSFYSVHTPLIPCREHVEHYRAKAASLPAIESPEKSPAGPHSRPRQDHAAYASMVHAVDRNVGRLFASLESSGIADSTIVVFTSDNGGHMSATSNRPLRAGKGWCYEGGIRVPLIVRLPEARANKSKAIANPVTSCDLFPTVLELADVEIDCQTQLDGVSLTGLLRGESLAARLLYWHFPHYHGSGWTPGSAIRDGMWKLIEFHEDDRIELYNLESDPGEQIDLSVQLPTIAMRLRNQLHDWQRDVSAKLPQKSKR